MELRKVKAHVDRDYWLETMLKIADPVLHALEAGKLKESMPLGDAPEDRAHYTYLEAFGRLVCGLAPWLEHGPVEGEEGEMRGTYAARVRVGIMQATNPASPDKMNFAAGYQPIVDAAFLAHAIVRAPRELFEKLPAEGKAWLVTALQETRDRKPHFNNWLLFSAMIETALFVMGEKWDPMRIDYALKQHEQWYLGDGVYGDGPSYRHDYYNSFVIQPMLVDIAEQLAGESWDWKELRDKINERAKRYGVIQERSISPEGTFPIVGRSLAYRFGAFQHLAQMALQGKLADELAPAQVRCALTAVIRRMIEMPGTFDVDGWLRIGVCGYQPELGEAYISTGSLYLCATVFLPLGLPAEDPFWQGEADWTAKKIWAGAGIPIDQGID